MASYGPFWLDDVFPKRLVIHELTVDDALAEVDERPATVVLRAPDRTTRGTFTGGTVDGDELTVPDTGAAVTLDVAGLWSLIVTVDDDGRPRRLPAVAVVVQDDDGWQSLDSAREDWAGAPISDGEVLELLTIAKAQVLSFAPDRYSAADAGIPVSFRRAQLMQARNLWNAITKDSSGELGGEGYSAPVFPLDWQVKNLIRPNGGKPRVR